MSAKESEDKKWTIETVDKQEREGRMGKVIGQKKEERR